MKTNTAITIVLILFVTFAVRLYPTIISEMPFSTDAWPLIRNTELLLQNTPVSLSSGLFDGYNNFWPANQLFGVVFSQILGLSPITAMALGMPIVAALAVPIFYFLVKRLTGNGDLALMATAIFSTAFPYALFMAGVTKETFASPIYLSVMLLFLLKQNWKTTLLFTVASVALVLSHHLTAFLTIGILLGLTVASLVTKKNPQLDNSFKSNMFLLVLFSGVTCAYFVLYALPAFQFALSGSDLLSVGAYQIVGLLVVLYFALKPKRQSKKSGILGQVVGLGFVCLMLVLITATSILPNAPIIPSSYLVFALPFILATPLMVFAVTGSDKKQGSLLFPIVWFVVLLVFGGYALFSNSISGVSYVYRTLNFLLAPLAILAAFGLYKFYKIPKLSARVWAKAGVLVLVFSMIALSVYGVYAAVSLQESYLGYFWRYEPSEFKASEWVTQNGGNQTVASDVKVQYLIDGYFNGRVDVMAGYSYLGGDGEPPSVLYVYDQMNQNGYVLYQSSPVTLPSNWTDKLSGYNCVYVNSEVSIYVKR
ncbi:MAG: hypothetical protein NWF01_11540 [Candidatus Bathyarchaeota archaeon]|nr:hypothetical protein [Candidatus Bathyarchaeota archaeon]